METIYYAEVAVATQACLRSEVSRPVVQPACDSSTPFSAANSVASITRTKVFRRWYGFRPGELGIAQNSRNPITQRNLAKLLLHLYLPESICFIVKPGRERGIRSRCRVGLIPLSHPRLRNSVLPCAGAGSRVLIRSLFFGNKDWVGLSGI